MKLSTFICLFLVSCARIPPHQTKPIEPPRPRQDLVGLSLANALSQSEVKASSDETLPSAEVRRLYTAASHLPRNSGADDFTVRVVHWHKNERIVRALCWREHG